MNGKFVLEEGKKFIKVKKDKKLSGSNSKKEVELIED
jgi:hypothetical protein